MQQITIGARNQIVIPSEVRKKIAGLKPGRKVSVYSADKNTVVIKVSDKNWLENSYGAMKHTWDKPDPVRQVEQIRNEWDEE